MSGPSRPARGTRVPAGGAVAATPPLGLRLARAGGRIVDARFLDRLLRGRTWIALLALGLMGIVFIQVSMLRLNAGISRAITSAETLHRQNSTLRADISKLDSSERIGDAAKSFGMIQPLPGRVTYLDARKANGAAAARGIHQPKPPKTAATTATATTATTTAPAAAATTATAPPPTTTTQAVTAPPPTQTQTQATTATPTTATTTAPAAAATTATAPPPTTTQAVTAPPPTQTQTQATTTPPATTAPATTAPAQQPQTQATAPAPATTATGPGGQ